MMIKKNCLWVQAMEAKYCQGKNLPQARVTSGASWIWQSILHTRDLIGAGFCWGARGGEDISIWCDPWVPGIPCFIPRLKMGIVVDRRLNRVCDLINDHENCWKENLSERCSKSPRLRQFWVYPCICLKRMPFLVFGKGSLFVRPKRQVPKIQEH